MELKPLWRPPLELVFVDLHEPAPVLHSVSDLQVKITMANFVLHFLGLYKAKPGYPGKDKMYVLFPDKGAQKRSQEDVQKTLGLEHNHILHISKSRDGVNIKQKDALFYVNAYGEVVELHKEFSADETVLMVDDFTNSGKSFIGAWEILKRRGSPTLHVFVSHLVANYDHSQAQYLLGVIRAIGPKCKLFVTDSIPVITSVLKGDPQLEVCELAEFIAELIANE